MVPAIPVASLEKDKIFDNDSEIQANHCTNSQIQEKKVPIIVAKSDRRGLFSSLCILPEYEEPRDFPNTCKNFIVFLVALASTIGPLGSSIILPAIQDVIDQLDTKTYLVNMSVGVYLLTLGVFPIWWSAISEIKGRRNVYLISFFLLVGFSVGCALSTNIGMLLAFRALSGAVSGSVQSVAAGSIADLYPPKERGTAMGFFYLGPLMGPFLAPLIGGAIATEFGFRGTQWFIVIFAAILVVLILFGLPETLRKVDLKMISENNLNQNIEKTAVIENKSKDTSNSESSTNSPKKIEKEGLEFINKGQKDIEVASNEHENSDSNSLNNSKVQKVRNTIYFYIIQPTKSVTLMKYPPVLFSIIFSGITFLPVHINNVALSNIYSEEPYNFSPMIVGLVYLPNSIGYIIASVFGGKYVDFLLNKYERKHGCLAPEARISYNILISIVLYPVSLLIMGWCFDQKTNWIFPLIGTFIFGFACMLTIGCILTYIVDSLPGKGATGIALNNSLRMILATAGTFFTEPLIRKMGVGPLYTLLSGLIVLSSVCVIVLKKRGRHWRETYDLEQLYDKLK
ncbi:MFS transporter [Ascoidea rubescens DSM 1968]|uniref:MFS general substrate transporter n=1 Tax=Ascoidea rubescens DSM 1968 TaxID=1344418 RepID=A0A1D2VPC5_9ASCO|nr:MFS general substrate transporter [Ascoidea rubescens DSM 1968]ODV63444.1 MFS general substrate transporter [Ascoidea rubescens DSM 1968]